MRVHHVLPNTRNSCNVGLMLAHRLRRWPNIRPTLGGHVFSLSVTPPSCYVLTDTVKPQTGMLPASSRSKAVGLDIQGALAQCWRSAGNDGPTLRRRFVGNSVRGRGIP